MRRFSAVALLSLLALGGQPAWPQAAAPLADDGARDAEAPLVVRFNFKGATFDQVLDFFSRTTGLPVVKETDVPQGTLDYLAPESYTLPEALRILNIILQAKGVTLRISDDMLYLQKLTEMQRENIPTYMGQVPAEIGSNEIITVVRPLEIELAQPLAAKLAAMVA